MTRRVSLKLTWKALAIAAGILAALVSTGCGDSSPTSPTPPSTNGPVIQSITPVTGTTFGGTVVTIQGTGFVAGATVAFGGTAATAVTVVSTQKITATTPAHASGAASVVVSGSTGSGTLA
ncbi:MAG TPA: IPT/TIG domain-containing protein, partial [Vicinamibacterales bacterium]